MKSSRLPPNIADPQLKYVASLKQQLKSPSSPITDQPPSTCLVHAPVSASYPPALQGPFLLQPAPKELGDGFASDIVYLGVEVADEVGNKCLQRNGNDESASLVPLVLIAYSDGKVDVCLDVEKVEAKWMKANTFVSTLSYFRLVIHVDVCQWAVCGRVGAAHVCSIRVYQSWSL
jgi:hypothetical protein